MVGCSDYSYLISFFYRTIRIKIFLKHLDNEAKDMNSTPLVINWYCPPPSNDYWTNIKIHIWPTKLHLWKKKKPWKHVFHRIYLWSGISDKSRVRPTLFSVMNGIGSRLAIIILSTCMALKHFWKKITINPDLAFDLLRTKDLSYTAVLK